MSVDEALAAVRPPEDPAEPFEMLVERGKIREFAIATRSSNPDYISSTVPVSPITFLSTAEHWRGPQNSVFGTAFMESGRILHGEQEFIFHGAPPLAGTRLVGQSRVANVYTKVGRRGGKMAFVQTVTEFRDETGRLVTEARGTFIQSESVGAAIGDPS